MTLFHKYYSRRLQFAADVLAALKGAPENRITASAAERLSLRYGMSPQLCSQTLNLLKQAELIEWDRTDRSWRLVSGWANEVPQLPTSRCEEDYLQQILKLPQASLFLPEALQRKLRTRDDNSEYDGLIQSLDPIGEQSQPALSQPEFRTLLEAITRGCAVSYEFKSRFFPVPVRTTAAPWRLEYSAYDNRWWILLYTLGEERRCVKAWLSNLSAIRLEPHITVPESEILAARDALRMPEPIVLRVKDTHNALDRCFLVMEQQQFTKSELHEDGSATLCFRYYRFDESDILRKLLYLGPGVELKSPAYLRKALLERVEQALENFSV